MTNCIGVDVSKQELSAFDGKKSFVIKNEKGLKGLKSYLNKRASSDDTVIIFESTGVYSGHLKQFCTDNRIKTCIVNPKRSSNFAKVIGNRSKTDKVDAKALYVFKSLIDKKDIKIPEIDKDVEQLSSYIKSYEFIVKTRCAISNHIEALKHNVNAPKALFATIKKELARYKKIEKKLLEDIKTYIKKKDNLREDYHNLLTVKGIGEVGAVSLLYLFKNYKNTNRSQITALTGLDPTRKESGSSVRGRRKISKGGNGTIRKILYFPTMNAIQHNKQIKLFYNRLVENHKPKKLALIAAMRKLLLTAHAVYMSKKPFQEQTIDV